MTSRTTKQKFLANDVNILADYVMNAIKSNSMDVQDQVGAKKDDLLGATEYLAHRISRQIEMEFPEDSGTKNAVIDELCGLLSDKWVVEQSTDVEKNLVSYFITKVALRRDTTAANKLLIKTVDVAVATKGRGLASDDAIHSHIKDAILVKLKRLDSRRRASMSRQSNNVNSPNYVSAREADVDIVALAKQVSEMLVANAKVGARPLPAAPKAVGGRGGATCAAMGDRGAESAQDDGDDIDGSGSMKAAAT